MISVEFLITSIIIILVPGTGVIYTVSNGLCGNRRSSIAAALGCTLGIVPHLTAGILGLSAIMHMSAKFFQILKFAGCLYLLYLAWSMWRSSGGMQFDGEQRNSGGLFRIIYRGILINLLNPKLTLFFFAFLPVFIRSEVSAPLPELQMAVLSLIFMLMTFAVFAVYGLLANFIKTRFGGSDILTRRVQKTFAVLLVPMAVKLALSEQ